MQEVFEDMVREVCNMYDDAIAHTDVVKLYKDLKIQKACADAQHSRLENELKKYNFLDQFNEDTKDELDQIIIQIGEFARVSETFQYVIDVIESGKFTKK